MTPPHRPPPHRASLALAASLLLVACQPAPALRPAPLPAALRPAAPPADAPVVTLDARAVRAHGAERVELLSLDALLIEAFEQPDAIARRSTALLAEVEDARRAGHADAPETRVLAGLDPLAREATRLAADSSALAYHARARACLSALQLVVAWHELVLDFATLNVRQQQAAERALARRARCASSSDLAALSRCAAATTAAAHLEAEGVHLRARWSARSRTLTRLLDRPDDVLLAPRSLRLTLEPRVADVDSERLITTSLEGDPFHQALMAEDDASARRVALAWWNMTGIKLGVVESLLSEREPPELAPDAPPLARAVEQLERFTGRVATLFYIQIILDWDYYARAWRELQLARSRGALTEVHVELHEETLRDHIDARLATVDGSRAAITHLAGRPREQTPGDAARRCALDLRCPLATLLEAQRQRADHTLALVSAILHHNLTQLELLAALGHLTPEVPL